MPAPANLIFRIVLSLAPVFVFLASLIVLDSFKLVRLRAVLITIALGCLVALLCFLINRIFLNELAWDPRRYMRYGAPVLEELAKAAYVLFLIKSKRVGFMVDSAIHGFALGAGFAFVENIYYLQSLTDPNILLWAIRGFGTAIMHGGTTAIFAVIVKSAAEREAQEQGRAFFFGSAAAIAIHSCFNHFLLPPLLMTALLVLTLPMLMIIVFQQSEKSTRTWLEIGFDSDQELLELLMSEHMPASRVGAYLWSLKKNFAPEIIVDLICYLRLHLELSIKAKGLLLMREAGFNPPRDAELTRAFAELTYLKKSLGRTGLLAISPVLSTRSQELWQLQLLGEAQ